MWTKKTAWHSEHTRKCFSGSGFLPVWNPQLELQPLPHTNLPWIFRLGISKASRVLKGKQVYKVSLWERDLYQISWIVVFSLRASLRHFTPLAVIWFWISLKKKAFQVNLTCKLICSTCTTYAHLDIKEQSCLPQENACDFTCKNGTQYWSNAPHALSETELRVLIFSF